MRRWIFGLAGLLLLSACSALPVPINLLNYLGADKSGSFQQPLPAGNVEFERPLPDKSGYSLDFSREQLYSVRGVRVEYGATVSYTGQTLLSGDVSVQAYLAPVNGEDLWQDKYKLGDPQNLQLAQGQSLLKLAGSVQLNNDQVKALNAKKLRFGVYAKGTASSSQAATVTLNYEVTNLTLKVALF
ncbi:MAG TPA: hypothetical protein VFS50_06950 [Meiothermus sp.]|nr:hypothetical protein [Meiothermus sp.]